MTLRCNLALLLPLLTLGALLSSSTPVRAQDRYDQRSSGVSATLRVSFGTRPQWTSVEGTRVEEVPVAQRPGYDVFRYNGSYYAFNNNHWYSSSRESGDFTAIDDRSVPAEFSRIPRDHWRSYPAGWQDRRDQDTRDPSASRWQDRHEQRYDTPATLRVDLGQRTRWMMIRGTRVRELRQGRRPDFDVFYYRGSYYAYSGDRWYVSPRGSGDYALLDDRRVPDEFTRIPQDHWRNYPSSWLDENGRPRQHRRDRYRDRNDQTSGGGYQH